MKKVGPKQDEPSEMADNKSKSNTLPLQQEQAATVVNMQQHGGDPDAVAGRKRKFDDDESQNRWPRSVKKRL